MTCSFIDAELIHSAGSDHVIVDRMKNPSLYAASNVQLADLARSHAVHNGEIFADGVVFLECRDDGALSFQAFTPDGNEPGLCVNAALCSYTYYWGMPQSARAGLIHNQGRIYDGWRSDLTLAGRNLFGFASSTGRPVEISMATRKAIGAFTGGHSDLALQDVTLADAGTPQLVALCDEWTEPALLVLGRAAQARRDLFPAGMNITLVRKGEGGRPVMQTYERGGAEITDLCASATVCAYLVLKDRLGLADKVLVRARSSIVRVGVSGAPHQGFIETMTSKKGALQARLTASGWRYEGAGPKGRKDNVFDSFVETLKPMKDEFAR